MADLPPLGFYFFPGAERRSPPLLAAPRVHGPDRDTIRYDSVGQGRSRRKIAPVNRLAPSDRLALVVLVPLWPMPPAFARASPLIASLAERRAPLSLSSAGRRPDAAALSPFDRAALETLGAEVVVPGALRRRGRSGDRRSGRRPAARRRRELAVGVGIATGEAFVGNIRAVDRMIWSAIGNTTNLAARLQGLTRELYASVVIDSATWERAGAATVDFTRRADVAIRGRRERQDVYALPIRSGDALPATTRG